MEATYDVEEQARPDDWDERRAFIESRQLGLGATDAAVVLGLHPWKRRLELFHDKVDAPIIKEPSLPAWLGLVLQGTVAELYAAKEGVRLRADNRHHRHRVHPFLLTHLDYRIVGQPERLVECKTTSRMTGWGEEYTDRVPIWHWCQAQHEMLVTGATSCDFAVLFGHHTFRVYRVPRDEAFLEKYVLAAVQFWNEWVVPRIEPPLDGSDYSKQLLRSRYPEDDGVLKPATPEHVAIVEQLRLAMQNAAQADGRVEELKDQVKDIIGEAAGLTGPFGKITWKKSKDSSRTDWALVSATLRNMVEQVVAFVPLKARRKMQKALGLEMPVDQAADTLISLYTQTTEGSRSFRVQWKEHEG